MKNRENVYILLDLIDNALPFLSMDLLESCFPYTVEPRLLRLLGHTKYDAIFEVDAIFEG